MKKKIIVTVDIDKNIDNRYVMDFVEEALSSWGGQRKPSDCLFNSLDIKRIQIGKNHYRYA